jgi:hypothetical protein
MKFSVYAFPWDVRARGAAAVAEELRDYGIDTCRIALVYHAVTAVSPDAIAGVLFSRPQGAFYFQPLPTTDFKVVRPNVDELALSPGELSEWAAIFADRGVSMVPWIVPTHDVADQPRLCYQVGPLGDIYTHAMCPANPDVRQYVVATARDLASRGIFPEIEIEHACFGTFDHYRFAHHPKLPARPLEPDAVALLSLCFCTDCCAAGEAADIDVSALRADCECALRTVFDSGGAIRVPAASDAALARYRDVRATTVARLAEELRRSLDIPIIFSPLFAQEISGFAAERCLSGSDQLLVLAYGRTASEIGTMIDALSNDGVRAGRIRLAIELGPRDDLADVVACADRRHVGNIGFYNYGLSSRSDRERMGRRLAQFQEKRVMMQPKER